MILVDSNIWIDIMGSPSEWSDWSAGQLKLARAQGSIVTNPVIYAEMAAAFDEKATLDAFLQPLKIKYMPLTEQAAYLAGQAFWDYRRRKGSKTGVLPDFFIGAHALAEGWTLLTRDATRYRSHFPGVKLISP